MPAIHPPTVQNHSEYILYVGTYSPGVQAFRFRVADGTLEALGQVGEVQNPSFLAVDAEAKHLYAVSELDGDANGGVAAFRIENGAGHLLKLNSQDSAGVAPCHLAIDRNNKRLLVANYGTGGVSIFPLQADGSLGSMTQLLTAQGSGPNSKRQQGPHAHEVVIAADGALAFVPDLGIDQIRTYHLGHPVVQQIGLQLPAGTGPRHLAFTHNGQYAFVFGELRSDITVFRRTDSLQYEAVQTLNSLPTPEDGGAEILIDRANKFVYTSNRDVKSGIAGSITVSSFEAGFGRLSVVERVPTAGPMPRGVEFDPSGKFLLVGDQKRNVIQVFAVDSATGKLTARPQSYPAPSPVAFAFFPVN